MSSNCYFIDEIKSLKDAIAGLQRSLGNSGNVSYPSALQRDMDDLFKMMQKLQKKVGDFEQEMLRRLDDVNRKIDHLQRSPEVSRDTRMNLAPSTQSRSYTEPRTASNRDASPDRGTVLTQTQCNANNAEISTLNRHAEVKLDDAGELRRLKLIEGTPKQGLDVFLVKVDGERCKFFPTVELRNKILTNEMRWRQLCRVDNAGSTGNKAGVARAIDNENFEVVEPAVIAKNNTTY